MIIVLSLNWHMKRKHKSYQTPFFALDTYLRICGKVNMSMWVNIAVSVLNIILYAILIVYFKLGIEYAAVTNALSMTVGCLLNGFEESTESMCGVSCDPISTDFCFNKTYEDLRNIFNTNYRWNSFYYNTFCTLKKMC